MVGEMVQQQHGYGPSANGSPSTSSFLQAPSSLAAAPSSFVPNSGSFIMAPSTASFTSNGHGPSPGSAGLMPLGCAPGGSSFISTYTAPKFDFHAEPNGTDEKTAAEKVKASDEKRVTPEQEAVLKTLQGLPPDQRKALLAHLPPHIREMSGEGQGDEQRAGADGASTPVSIVGRGAAIDGLTPRRKGPGDRSFVELQDRRGRSASGVRAHGGAYPPAPQKGSQGASAGTPRRRRKACCQ